MAYYVCANGLYVFYNPLGLIRIIVRKSPWRGRAIGRPNKAAPRPLGRAESVRLARRESRAKTDKKTTVRTRHGTIVSWPLYFVSRKRSDVTWTKASENRLTVIDNVFMASRNVINVQRVTCGEYTRRVCVFKSLRKVSPFDRARPYYYTVGEMQMNFPRSQFKHWTRRVLLLLRFTSCYRFTVALRVQVALGP